MSDSLTEVLTGSMYLIGQDELTDIATDTSRRGRVARRLHLDALDATLRAGEWNFAKVDGAAISADTVAPNNTNWSFKFQLPADPYAVKVLEVYTGGVPEPFKVFGRFIFCNFNPITLDYISRVSEVTAWDSLFLQTYQHRMAAMMAIPLTGKRTLFNDMWTIYQQLLSEAGSIDAQEGTPKSIDMTALTQVRF